MLTQDKSTMLTVKHQYVKPLEIIWSKCGNLGWGPHNTIHVDDLERNFELNKQCGVLISPFHLKPVPPPDALGAPDGPGKWVGVGMETTDATSADNMPLPPPASDAQRRPSLSCVNGNENGNGHANGDSHSNGDGHGDGRSNGKGKGNAVEECVTPPSLEKSERSRSHRSSSNTNSSSAKSIYKDKGFEDKELQLLARYLVYIAVTVSDFSAVDHSLWRTRALEMPSDRDH